MTRSKFNLDRLHAATVGMLPVPTVANAGFAELIYFLAPNRSPKDLLLLSLMHSSCHMEAYVVILLQYSEISQEEDHPPCWMHMEEERLLTQKFVMCGLHRKSLAGGNELTCQGHWTGQQFV